MRELEATFQRGLLSIEHSIKPGIHEVGIQIAEDGRIWLCVDGQAFIRFKPIGGEQDESNI